MTDERRREILVTYTPGKNKLQLHNVLQFMKMEVFAWFGVGTGGEQCQVEIQQVTYFLGQKHNYGESSSFWPSASQTPYYLCVAPDLLLGLPPCPWKRMSVCMYLHMAQFFCKSEASSADREVGPIPMQKVLLAAL